MHLATNLVFTKRKINIFLKWLVKACSFGAFQGFSLKAFFQKNPLCFFCKLSLEPVWQKNNEGIVSEISVEKLEEAIGGHLK